MKTIHLHIQEDPIEFMRKLYKSCLTEDKTFHFVNWSNVKWQGYKFKGVNVLLRIDEDRIDSIKKYLKDYYGTSYEIYDYPFPNRRGHLNRFGLGKKSIEAKFPDLFHKIYHLYSVMSMVITKDKDRQEALFQLLHIPLNVYHTDFISEAEIYSLLAYEKIRVLKNTLL